MTAPAERLRVVHGARSVEIIATLDRRRAEVLAVELRAIARRHGLRVQSVRVEGAGKRADETARRASV